MKRYVRVWEHQKEEQKKAHKNHRHWGTQTGRSSCTPTCSFPGHPEREITEELRRRDSLHPDWIRARVTERKWWGDQALELYGTR